VNFNKKIFITDFDGTFLKTDSSLCKKNIKEIVKIKNKGVITAVATGRSIYSFDLAFARLKIKPDFLNYLIFSTGAGILYYPDKKIIKASGVENAPIDLKAKFKIVPSNDCGAVRTAIKNWTNNFSKYETESFT
jgi:hypothetical protein